MIFGVVVDISRRLIVVVDVYVDECGGNDNNPLCIIQNSSVASLLGVKPERLVIDS